LQAKNLNITIAMEEIYYGNTLRDWLISASIVVCAFIINQLVLFLFNGIIRKITAKSKSALDDVVAEALKRPLLLGIALFALWYAIERLNFDPELVKNIHKSFIILTGLLITWLFASFASRLIEEQAEEDKDGKKKKKGKFYIDARLYPLIKRSTLVIIWTIGVISTLHNIGIDLKAVLGALGIGGVAVAFAAQDTLKNIIAGLTILTGSSFRLGDVIRIDTTEGTVTDIGLRTTNIRTYDKRIVMIPNYKFTDSVITNISSEPGRRIVMELGLTYDTSPEKMKLAMSLLHDIPNKIKDVKAKDMTIAFTDFKDSSLCLTFIFFINKGSDIFETRSRVNYEILESFNRAGISFAFPSSTVYLAGVDGGDEAAK
jgi:MscS family membrane protein